MIKGLLILSKRNWYNDVDSIIIDEFGLEFGEFVDEIVLVVGLEVEKKLYGSIYKNKMIIKKVVEEIEKRVIVEK